MAITSKNFDLMHTINQEQALEPMDINEKATKLDNLVQTQPNKQSTSSPRHINGIKEHKALHINTIQCHNKYETLMSQTNDNDSNNLNTLHAQSQRTQTIESMDIEQNLNKKDVITSFNSDGNIYPHLIIPPWKTDLIPPKLCKPTVI